MAIIYTQTDTDAATAGGLVNCSGSNFDSSEVDQVTSEGGSAGSTPITCAYASSASNANHIGFEITPAAGVSWDAGDWTVRFNVTTANMNLTAVSVYICRTNSSDVNQATIGSATGLSISLGTTGVKTQTVTGASQSPAAGDKVFVFVLVTNGAMSTQTFAITPNQNIDSPFSAAAVEASKYWRRTGNVPGMRPDKGHGPMWGRTF